MVRALSSCELMTPKLPLSIVFPVAPTPCEGGLNICRLGILKKLAWKVNLRTSVFPKKKSFAAERSSFAMPGALRLVK